APCWSPFRRTAPACPPGCASSSPASWRPRPPPPSPTANGRSTAGPRQRLAAGGRGTVPAGALPERGERMTVSERAGQPAEASMLVDVDKLVKAYYEERPDPGDASQQVAFGTSGHRGSALKGSFNEAHILATTEAICRYRSQQGIDGPLFLARDTHALSEPAQRTALEVLAANGV